MIKPYLNQLISGQDLSDQQMREVFEQLTAGELTDMEIAGFLSALACKGPSPVELGAAAAVMRRRLTQIPVSVDAVDTCGTGGDGKNTFNISTCAGIIAAGAGAYVAKHGNKTNTRVSGSAEVLQALGVNLDADVHTVAKCIEQAHIGFCYAIKLHPSMKYAAPVRRALGVKTIFNMLGPLCNPALVTRQIIGVPKQQDTELIAHALQHLGLKRAMVIFGHVGLCDISIAGPTTISELTEGQVNTYTVTPQDIGLEPSALDDIMVNSPQESAQRIRDILSGQHGTSRQMAAANAAAALTVAGLADDLKQGYQLACQSIDSGNAQKALEDLIRISNEG